MSLDLNPNDLITLKTILKTLLPSHPVWAFGSRVKGSAKPFSDLDIVIINTQPLTIELYTELRQAFSDSDLPFLVDIVDWSSISTAFQKLIQQNYEVIQS